jgi:hypothetical protein
VCRRWYHHCEPWGLARILQEMGPVN